jgi:hypothetical protein
MPWITVNYHPGFAEDLTSWTTCIESDGSLSQTVRVSRFAPREERTDHFTSQLSPEQVSELRRFIAATDFNGVTAAARSFVIDDACESQRFGPYRCSYGILVERLTFEMKASRE